MLFQDRHEKPGYFLIAFLQYIFMVKPFSFFKVEFCPGFAATVQVKKLHQFIQGHQFLVISRIPSQQGKEIDNSFGQVTRLTITGRHLTGLGVVPFQRETGKPRRSPSRLLSLPLPSGFNNKGRCANSGMVSAQPKARYSRTCNGAEGNHSSPRITWETSIKWSSTMFANDK